MRRRFFRILQLEAALNHLQIAAHFSSSSSSSSSRSVQFIYGLGKLEVGRERRGGRTDGGGDELMMNIKSITVHDRADVTEVD